MTTEDDFQRALDADPSDWQTRLVLADWLQERDDPRAAGYRALGELQITPHTFKMKSRGRVLWCYHDGRGLNTYPYGPEKGITCSWRHALPPVWFRAAAHHKDDIWVFAADGSNYSERRCVEDRAARAFGLLASVERAAVLAAGRSRLRCAAAMGV